MVPYSLGSSFQSVSLLPFPVAHSLCPQAVPHQPRTEYSFLVSTSGREERDFFNLSYVKRLPLPPLAVIIGAKVGVAR